MKFSRASTLSHLICHVLQYYMNKNKFINTGYTINIEEQLFDILRQIMIYYLMK